MRPGEFLVFQLDSRTGALISADGVLAFRSRGDARRYALDQIANAGEFVYEIYDERGRTEDPVEKHFGKPQDANRARRSARWRIGIGAVLLAAAPFFIADDVNHELRLVWGCLLGIKCFLVGTVTLAQGFLGLRAVHRESAARPVHTMSPLSADFEASSEMAIFEP